LFHIWGGDGKPLVLRVPGVNQTSLAAGGHIYGRWGDLPIASGG